MVKHGVYWINKRNINLCWNYKIVTTRTFKRIIFKGVLNHIYPWSINFRLASFLIILAAIERTRFIYRRKDKILIYRCDVPFWCDCRHGMKTGEIQVGCSADK
jgi:hypothetical protein